MLQQSYTCAGEKLTYMYMRYMCMHVMYCILDSCTFPHIGDMVVAKVIFKGGGFFVAKLQSTLYMLLQW